MCSIYIYIYIHHIYIYIYIYRERERERERERQSKHINVEILTWIGEFRPGNKTVWVVFDEESDVLGPRT